MCVILPFQIVYTYFYVFTNVLWLFWVLVYDGQWTVFVSCALRKMIVVVVALQ